MASLTIHAPGGEVLFLEAEAGVTIMEALSEGGISVPSPCGGRGVCGKCKIMVSGEASEPDERERAFLKEELSSGVRLACRARIIGDLEISLEDMERAASIQSEGIMPSFEANPLFEKCGLAVDIGTTTVVARLYGRDGLLGEASIMNPQRRYGADVITRIERSLAGDAAKLSGAIREGITELIEKLSSESGAAPESIDAAVITGNTTMLYLLAERDVSCLARAPFVADELFGRMCSADELGLDIISGCRIYLPRCMGAFVGADITTALLASGIHEKDETAMMADIGTNGEICLWSGGRLLCTSTAAGPVFEGATLSRGMQGSEGAIEHVSLAGKGFDVRVIGNVEASGICGSGIVDAVSCFLEAELVEDSGAMADDEDEIPLTETVSVTQKDIRMVQLAKGAVCAGMMTLMETAGLSTDDIEILDIAGGFGSHLDVHNAAAIGLYPMDLEDRVRILGNAALSGAAMLLMCKEFIKAGERLAEDAEVVELSSNPLFTEYYMDCMQFEQL